MTPEELKEFLKPTVPEYKYEPGRYALGSYGAHELVDRLGTIVGHLREDIAIHPALFNPDPSMDMYRAGVRDAIIILTGVLVGIGNKHGTGPSIN